MVGLLRQGNEVQTESARHRGSVDAAVRLAAADEARGGKVSRDDPVVTFHLGGGNPGLVQQVIEQAAAASSRLAIGKPHVLARQIGYPGDVFRVARSRYQSFLPQGIGEHRHGVPAEQLGDGPKIDFAGNLVHQVGAGDVHQSLLEQFERA